MARKVHVPLPSERASDLPERQARTTTPLRDLGQLQSVRAATDPERVRTALLAADHALGTADPTGTMRDLLDALGLRPAARTARGV